MARPTNISGCAGLGDVLGRKDVECCGSCHEDAEEYEGTGQYQLGDYIIGDCTYYICCAYANLITEYEKSQGGE